MPSIAAHFACANLVARKLDIKDDDFYIGNILPDIIDLSDSHFKIRGNYYLIPDVDYFIEEYDLNNYQNLGYLTHLLLDKYFLEEFIPKFIIDYKEKNLFVPNMIYQDYSNLNILIVRNFNLDLDYINSIMSDINVKLNNDKYNFNLKNINNKEITDDLKVLNLETFVAFLDEVSLKIANTILELKENKNGCKRKKLQI